MVVAIKQPISVTQYINVRLPEYTFGYHLDKVTIAKRCSINGCGDNLIWIPEDGGVWCQKHHRYAQ